VNLLGNLDCEARWAGVALPDAVLARISLYATLFAACAPRPTRPAPDDEPHQIWVPAAVDPARLLAPAGWTPPVPRTGEPVGVELAWADPSARAANDRSRTLAIAEALGVALPGARLVGSLAELDAHAAGFAGRRWVCKARWTSAARDRAHGSGSRVDGELRVRLGRMLERFGPLVFEPWLDRVADLGVCGQVAAGGEVTLAEPHRMISDARGRFLGIDLVPVDRALVAALTPVARGAAQRLAVETGYRGPFAVDAFVYRDGDAQRLHPLCELNARFTFGWIAHALARRLGARRLGFAAPPPGATVLIAPGDDRVTAWCA
jgi:hypothetical protein